MYFVLPSPFSWTQSAAVSLMTASSETPFLTRQSHGVTLSPLHLSLYIYLWELDDYLSLLWAVPSEDIFSSFMTKQPHPGPLANRMVMSWWPDHPSSIWGGEGNPHHPFPELGKRYCRQRLTHDALHVFFLRLVAIISITHPYHQLTFLFPDKVVSIESMAWKNMSPRKN